MNELNDKMERLEMTLAQFAKYYGVSVYTMRNWLRGDRKPNSIIHRVNELFAYIEFASPELNNHLIAMAKGEK
jgi:transcriptional regulator with XRE-family HTH domain